MRFNKRNWNKYFDGSNKKTTIRLKPMRIGKHNCYAGSYFKPELLGTVEVTKTEERLFCDLTEKDARNDGFESLKLLKEELLWLNKKITPKNKLYINWTENVT